MSDLRFRILSPAPVCREWIGESRRRDVGRLAGRLLLLSRKEVMAARTDVVSVEMEKGE